MRRSSSSWVQSGGSESTTARKSSASAIRRNLSPKRPARPAAQGALSPGAHYPHRPGQLLAEAVLAAVGAHGERAAERLAPHQPELVAGGDPAPGQVAQHLR